MARRRAARRTNERIEGENRRSRAHITSHHAPRDLCERRTADGARDGNRKSIFVLRTDLEAFVVHASALRKSLLTFWLSLARSRAKLRNRIVVISPHIEFCNAMTFFYIDRNDCEKFF